MNDTALFSFELNFSAFCCLYCSFNIDSNRTNFWVWHKVSWTQDLPQPPYNWHHIWCGNTAIKINSSRLHSLHQVLRTNNVGTCSFCLVRLCISRKNSNTHRFTRSVRQTDNATHHLIRMPCVYAQVHGDLDRFVKFSLCIFFD